MKILFYFLLGLFWILIPADTKAGWRARRAACSSGTCSQTVAIADEPLLKITTLAETGPLTLGTKPTTVTLEVQDKLLPDLKAPKKPDAPPPPAVRPPDTSGECATATADDEVYGRGRIRHFLQRIFHRHHRRAGGCGLLGGRRGCG